MRVVQLPQLQQADPETGEGLGKLPVVPAAEFSSREGRSGHYIVYFAPTDRRWVKLFRVGGGRFLITEVHGAGLRQHFPEGVAWAAFLRTSLGRKFRHWLVDGTDASGPVRGRRIRASADVPDDAASVTKPWTLGDMTITKARPTLPSTCGHPPNFLRDNVEASA